LTISLLKKLLISALKIPAILDNSSRIADNYRTSASSPPRIADNPPSPPALSPKNADNPLPSPDNPATIANPLPPLLNRLPTTPDRHASSPDQLSNIHILLIIILFQPPNNADSPLKTADLPVNIYVTN
jgi:hypothetical protein